MRIVLDNILACTDFSEYSNQTLAYGIALAREFDAKLYVCHVVDIPPVVSYGDIYFDTVDIQTGLTDSAHEQIDALIGDQPVEWEPVIAAGQTADEIARVAEDKKIDLAISATHILSGLKRFVIGSVTERLMRTLPCPLLVVRRPEHDFIEPATGEIRLKRILVGCDFSEYAALALRHGLSLAQDFEAELHLAHVIESPGYDDILKPDGRKDKAAHKDIRDRLNEKLDGLTPAEALEWCTLKKVLLAGKPDEELTKYAALNEIDLIVLGIRGYTLMESLLVGSTTDRVIRRAPCPVLSAGRIAEADQGGAMSE